MIEILHQEEQKYFSASIGTSSQVTSSFISGTVFFRAFTSCSGPTPSPNSDLLSFTYDLIATIK